MTARLPVSRFLRISEFATTARRQGLVSHRSSATPADPTARNMLLYVKKSAPFRNLVATGLGTSAIYFGPFEHTREGLFVAFHYPHHLVQMGSATETFWRFIVGISGLGAAFTSVRAVTLNWGVASSIARTQLSLFAGVLTAMICVENSEQIVATAMRCSKAVSYGLDGLMADTVGRTNPLPVWERHDGITSEALLRWKASLAKKSDTVKENEDDGMSIDVSSMTLKDIETKLAVLSLSSGPSGSAACDKLRDQLLEKHESLLIAELVNLRRAQPSSYEEQVEMETRKKDLKRSCQRMHGSKLTWLLKEQLAAKADRLSYLRKRQLELARKSRASSSDRLVAAQEIMDMEIEKKQLKDDGQRVYGVSLSSMARSETSWKIVLNKL